MYIVWITSISVRACVRKYMRSTYLVRYMKGGKIYYYQVVLPTIVLPVVRTIQCYLFCVVVRFVVFFFASPKKYGVHVQRVEGKYSPVPGVLVQAAAIDILPGSSSNTAEGESVEKNRKRVRKAKLIFDPVLATQKTGKEFSDGGHKQTMNDELIDFYEKTNTFFR